VDEGFYRELLRPLIAGRPIVVTGAPLAGLVPLVREVRLLGATRVFALGSEGRGSGPIPAREEAESLVLDLPPARTMVEGIHAGQAVLADLPAHARAAVDRFDPTGEALVVAHFLNEAAEVAGRPCLAYRHREWVALEDKTTVDELWDRCGVTRAPAEVVPAEGHALIAAARRLDQGSGTVWAADARGGYNGGAEGLRWVRGDHIDESVDFMVARAEQVRVMPFLEGIPCSVHGIVFADYVAALRPLEMITLQPQTGSGLFYAGVASFWDPSPSDRENMRAVARTVGAALRHEVGFRGPFTVDGVMSIEGFLPTELNPRSGAGLHVLTRALSDLPVQTLLGAISAGVDLDYRSAALESLLIGRADNHRGGGTWRAMAGHVPAILRRSVVQDQGGYRWGDESDTADGWVTAGPSALGAYLRLDLNPSRTPNGTSVAPRAAAFYRFADLNLGTAIGPLQTAKTVR
jgi:hypothetical protein